MRARLFWKLGLTYFALLLGVLLAAYLYSSHVLLRDYIRFAGDNLASLTSLAQARPPRLDDAAELRAWTEWMATSGARVTVIDNTGRVLADSAHDPETMENHSNRPEIQQAFASGKDNRFGTVQSSVATSCTAPCVTSRRPAPPVVIRMAFPLSQIDSSLAELRRRLLAAALVIVLVGGAISLIYFRVLAARVEKLERFAHRVTQGDFRPLPSEGSRDELSDLTDALNETAAWMDGTIRSLSGERNRSSAILRSMVEGVAVIDAQERIVFSNRAFSEILNLDPAAIEGRPVIEVVRNSDLLGLIRRALKGEEGLQTDVAIGIVQQRSFSITATPVQALEAGGRPAAAHLVG